VFSDAELEEVRRFPGSIAQNELIRYLTLMPGDVALVNGHRGAGNRTGVAVQLCSLPWLGFVPDEVASVPPAATARLPEQLLVPVGELRSYGMREQTRTDHIREVAGFLGWRAGGEVEFKELDQFLLARAMEHDSPALLFRLACEHLRSSRGAPRPRPATGDQQRAQRGRVVEPRQRRAVLRQGRRLGHQPPRGAGDDHAVLRILQAALVYVNTLMLQDVLADDERAALLTGPDRRGLTPLFWQHVLPYGESRLDMSSRLGLTPTAG
jgi:hypothetical protein